jgi:hypothetical protein
LVGFFWVGFFWAGFLLPTLSRGLPQLPRLCLHAAGRLHQGGDAPTAHGALQQQPQVLLLHPEHALRRRGHQPDGGGHGRLLRQRLESHNGRAGAGSLPSDWPDARRSHLQVPSSVSLVFNSVGVFGPTGSGSESISQMYGSGSLFS